MCLQMGAQIRFVGEGSMTILATEWFVASVCANVSLQQPRSRKCFAAQMALARFGVRSNVHFECAHRCVRLRAVFTTKRFLHFARRRCGAMELLVFRESWIGGIRSRTIGALVTWHFIFHGNTVILIRVVGSWFGDGGGAGGRRCRVHHVIQFFGQRRTSRCW